MTNDDEHDNQDPVADKKDRPSALPNPLAGNVKLTLPGQLKPTSARHFRETTPDESAGDEADGPGADSIESDSAPQDNRAAGTGSEDNSDGESAEDSDSFGPDDETAKGADRKLIKAIAVSVSAFLAIAAIVWISARPDEKPEKPAGRQVAQPTGAAQAPAGGKPAIQDDILPATFNAECAGQTDPKLAASTDPRSAWTCPTDGVPFGQKLIATLPKPYVITGICYWPGFQGAGPDGRDAWFHHRVITEAQAVFNDIDKTLVPMRPGGVRSEYCLPLNRVLASVMEFTVMASDAPPPEPKLTPTSAPPGAPSNGQPDMGELFPSAGPDAESSSENNPNAAAIALWGFKLKGHAVP
ncbi:hypothetical protein [Mycolicibacterium lutetiense]